MFKSDCPQEGDMSMTAVKQEIITIKEEYDDLEAALDLNDLNDFDDPLEINQKERELFLKEEELSKEEPEVVMVRRGGPGLVYQGYTYTKYYMYKHKQVIRWVCQRKCRGSLNTSLKCKEARVLMVHSHPPDFVVTEAAKLKYSLFGRRICNFFRKDGTFVVPYKENAKKKQKARNPFGIQNTLHCW